MQPGSACMSLKAWTLTGPTASGRNPTFPDVHRFALCPRTQILWRLSAHRRSQRDGSSKDTQQQAEAHARASRRRRDRPVPGADEVPDGWARVGVPDECNVLWVQAATGEEVETNQTDRGGFKWSALRSRPPPSSRVHTSPQRASCGVPKTRQRCGHGWLVLHLVELAQNPCLSLIDTTTIHEGAMPAFEWV